MVWYPIDDTKACVRENGAGFAYEEIACLYPTYGKTVLPWEWKYDLVPLRDSMVTNPWVPILACVLYGIFIVVGRAYFSKRDPWSWRKCLALWNLSLSLFSAIGFVRATAQLIHNLSHYSMHDIFCNDPENAYGSGVTGASVLCGAQLAMHQVPTWIHDGSSHFAYSFINRHLDSVLLSL
jgi:hypothetical protein